jgi:hypothetical protein
MLQYLILQYLLIQCISFSVCIYYYCATYVAERSRYSVHVCAFVCIVFVTTVLHDCFLNAVAILHVINDIAASFT